MEKGGGEGEVRGGRGEEVVLGSSAGGGLTIMGGCKVNVIFR